MCQDHLLLIAEISREYLKHGQEEMFFAGFVLISIDGEHDSLEEGVDFLHGHQLT